MSFNIGPSYDHSDGNTYVDSENQPTNGAQVNSMVVKDNHIFTRPELMDTELRRNLGCF